MGKDLLIVESPSKASTINKYLGGDFEVLASVGHIRDLPKKKFGVDIENGFKPKYVTVYGKKKIIKKMQKAAQNANDIYLAPDPDREGEAIAWHISVVLDNHSQKINRVLFNEITQSGIKEGLKEPRDINKNLVDAQKARRILDRIVGYRVSPFLWKTLYRGLSAGRVQSVAARLICEKEQAREEFDPEEYWNFYSHYLTPSEEKFRTKCVKVDGKKLNGKRFTIDNGEDAKKHAQKMKAADHIVDRVKIKNKKKTPGPPFTTSLLQQIATKIFNYSPSTTMDIAQRLYEGIEIEGEPVGLITYMRTDSMRISKEAIGKSRGHIQDKFGDDYLPKKPNFYKSSGDNVQDAHECIRPTNFSLPPKKVAKYMNKGQEKIYRLIWQRFIASQMTAAIFKRKTIDVQADQYTFRVRGENEIFAGYLKAYRTGKKSKKKKKKKVPEDIQEGEELEQQKLEKKQKFTQPPARYTEGTLVKKLDNLGIGRPSTYASIVSTIINRKYIVKENRKLKPTELGRTVNNILVNEMPEIFNVEFTGQMEEDLDKIESGEKDWQEVMEEFYQPFKESLDQAMEKKDEIKANLVEETEEECEKCGGTMVIKWGRNGKFKACSNYPDCKNTKPLNPPDTEDEEVPECPECGAEMKLKEGRYGKFWACPNYPDCKSTLPYTIGIGCPEEDCDGEITERQTKSGKTFWGCTNYPDCEFSSWNKPVDRECPNCGYGAIMEGKKNLYCPECNHKYSKEEEKIEEKS